MDRGVLYGVGVGPGDPGLMTLKAAAVIRSCPAVAAPRTKNGGMVALDIAREALDLSGKTILPLDFAMSRDASERAASHRAAADLLRRHLDRGESVAVLNLGDVSIYASFRYLADILGPEGYAIEMVAGVTSFCAAAAALGATLTDMDSPLHIIPGPVAADDGACDLPGTVVWMKSGRGLRRLLRRLRSRGLLGEAVLVQNCGMADQRLCRDLENADVAEDYLSLVILRNAGGGRP